MKYTHNALTSITVEKVENITTSMTRAGLGDDTYRRQRQKERYLKCKQQQAEKEEKRREEFMNERGEKMKQAQMITEKKNLKRQKKKELQKQRQKKMKLLKKLGEQDVSDSQQANCSNQHPQEEINDESRALQIQQQAIEGAKYQSEGQKIQNNQEKQQKEA